MVTVLGNTLIVYFFTCEIVFYYDLMLRYVCEFFEVPQRQVCCDSTFHCYFEYISFVLVWRLVSYFTWFIDRYAVPQFAWGSYWSWDPKETLTLLLFEVISATFVFYYKNRLKLATSLSVVSCCLSVITALSSFIIAGLHSFI